MRASSASGIRRSVAIGDLVGLEDGKRDKTLKRHLGSHGLTSDQSRAKGGLPPDDPVIAPADAAQQSRPAKGRGFAREFGATA